MKCRTTATISIISAICFFTLNANAFEGVPTSGVEVKLSTPFISVDRISTVSYWKDSSKNRISKDEYESYVSSKMEKLIQNEPGAFKSYANAPVSETSVETKLKFGIDIGLMSMHRTWSWLPRNGIGADQEAHYRLQAEGYDPQPNFHAGGRYLVGDLIESLDASGSADTHMCTEFLYLSVSKDSPLCK